MVINAPPQWEMLSWGKQGVVAGIGKSMGISMPPTQFSYELNCYKINKAFFFFSNGPNGEGNGNPLQYSCLRDATDIGAWWATVHGVAKSRIGLSNQIKQNHPRNFETS